MTKLKESKAWDIVDEFDDCISTKHCIADVVQAVYIRGFEDARAEIAKLFKDRATRIRIKLVGEDE